MHRAVSRCTYIHIHIYPVSIFYQNFKNIFTLVYRVTIQRYTRDTIFSQNSVQPDLRSIRSEVNRVHWAEQRFVRRASKHGRVSFNFFCTPTLLPPRTPDLSHRERRFRVKDALVSGSFGVRVSCTDKRIRTFVSSENEIPMNRGERPIVPDDATRGRHSNSLRTPPS